MSEPTALAANDETYRALEAALTRMPLGRWFLSETLRRHQTEQLSGVLSVVERLERRIDTPPAAAKLDILEKELRMMSQAVAQTRQEISEIRPSASGNNRIMAATEELDAIVTATERATSDILGAAETIQDAIELLRARDSNPDQCTRIEAAIIDIFTACSFQDITGQRTTKVVNLLRYLEQRVNTMIEIWGNEEDGTDSESLINGPALDGEGVSQDDIDAMLDGGFDSVEADPEAASA